MVTKIPSTKPQLGLVLYLLKIDYDEMPLIFLILLTNQTVLKSMKLTRFTL